MILADTSIWADHFRSDNSILQGLLADDQLLMHPFVLGEIALGYLRRRQYILNGLAQLTSIHMADPEEVLSLIDIRGLVGSGVGYVDAHLLASTLSTSDCQLWTRDKRLRAVAERLGVAAKPEH